MLDLVREATSVVEPPFASIQTDYSGGSGHQWAVAFRGGTRRADHPTSTNTALAALRVRASSPNDEFDTIELVRYRSNRVYLDRYYYPA